MLNRLRTVGHDYGRTVNYTQALRIPRSGTMEIVIANDTILGGGGDDVLLGDNAELTPYAFRNTEFVSGRYEVRSLPRLGRVYSNTNIGGNDSIDGGDGDDRIDGQHGEDTLAGGQGADSIYGGPRRDTIVRDDSDVIVRNGGRLARTTLIDTTNLWIDHLNSVTADSVSQIDARSTLWVRIRLNR